MKGQIPVLKTVKKKPDESSDQPKGFLPEIQKGQGKINKIAYSLPKNRQLELLENLKNAEEEIGISSIPDKNKTKLQSPFELSQLTEKMKRRGNPRANM